MKHEITEALLKDPEVMEAVKQWSDARDTWKDNTDVLLVNDEALIDRLKFLRQRQEIVSYGSYMDTPLFVQVGD